MKGTKANLWSSFLDEAVKSINFIKYIFLLFCVTNGKCTGGASAANLSRTVGTDTFSRTMDHRSDLKEQLICELWL